MSRLPSRWVVQAFMGGVLLVTAAPLPAQDAGKKPAHIFDFGGFDDAPATQPTVRERTPPARTPVPGVVTPTPTPTPVPRPTPTPTPKPVQPDSPVPALPAVDPAIVAPESLVMSPIFTQGGVLLPVPAATQASTAIAAVQKTYAADLTKAQDRVARRNLALMLLETSARQGVPTAEQYGLVMVALQLAVTSGDVAVAVQVADGLAYRFAVDELSTRSAALTEMAAKAITANDAHALATAAVPLIEAATREDDFDTAERLAQAAELCATRAAPRDAALLGRVRVLTGEMRAAKAQHAVAKPALDAIAAGRATPAHLGVAGKYICYTKRDWTRGLPLLASSDDPKVKSIALRELALPEELPQRMALADDWWAVASVEAPATRGQVMDRAAHWYREVLPQLQGPDSVTPQTRIGQALAATRKLEPGLVAEFFYDPGLRMRQKIRIDPFVVGDFSKNTSELNVDGDIFGIRWTGMIKAPKTGTYTFSVKVKESIRIWIDGMLVLKADNPTSNANADVLMVEGLHDIRIHYNSRGDKSMVRLAWSSAGQFKDQAIGAQYFFHDARAGGEYLAGTSLLPDFYDRTQRVGGTGGGFYDESAADSIGTLAGFHVSSGKWSGHSIVKSLTPVFQNSAGQKSVGRTFGNVTNTVQMEIAKPGYAVSAVTARGGARLNCFKVQFARLNPNGTLNMADTYESQWIGGQGGNEENLLGGDGRPVIGICGRCGADIDSMGLILRGKPSASNVMAIVSARWGGGDKWADVTPRIRVMLRDNKSLKATHTDLASDPTPGRRKRLEIVYQDRGVKKTITIDEGSAIAIPGLISR